MDPLSATPQERSRKMHSMLVRSLERPGTQAAIAIAMGVSESEVSRMKNEKSEQFFLMLAHAGMKVVPADKICVDKEAYESMTYIASKAMADRDISKRLIWEDE